jgi:hypothetical protein
LTIFWMSASERTARSLDADLLLLAGGLVLGRDLDDAVGVDVEGHLDLRHAARRRAGCRPDRTGPSSLFWAAISRSPWNTRMVTAVWLSSAGREGLALLGRDRRVALDQAREHAAQRLDAERQRRHVEQQDVLDLALQALPPERRRRPRRPRRG